MILDHASLSLMKDVRSVATLTLFAADGLGAWWAGWPGLGHGGHGHLRW